MLPSAARLRRQSASAHGRTRTRALHQAAARRPTHPHPVRLCAHCADKSVDSWLEKQDFGRVFSQTSKANQSFSSQAAWKAAGAKGA